MTESTDDKQPDLSHLAARMTMVRSQSSHEYGDEHPPPFDANTLTVHDLLSIASDALEVAAHMEHDDLDMDDDDGSETVRPRGSSFVTDGVHTFPALHRTASNHEDHLDEEVKDLAHLDEAFEHLADRFKRRLSVRMLDDYNNQEHDDPRDPSHSRRGPSISRPKKWRKNNLAAIWSHHIEHGLLVFYQVPKVRQFYEDTQHEHEVDWADLFFDLTYVAAAYQLGEKLKADVSWSGVIYAAIVGVSMIDCWKFKTLHDSTFEATDVVHKVFDVLYVCSVAFAAIFISPLSDMRHLETGFAFGLSISLTANAFILGVEKLEIIFKTHSPAAKEHCRLGILMEVLPRFLCFLTASVVAGLGWAQARGHYHLDGDFTYFTVAFFLAFAHVLGTIAPLLGYMWKLLPASPIPWHYQHIAHRYGELIMLMLGEGVLSMILVPVVSDVRYYATFALGLVTIQLLQLVHFETEEFDPTKHALSRKLRAGRIWLELMTIYCIALICFGVALKLMLKSIFCADDDYGHRRDLLASTTYSSSYSSSSYGSSSYESSYGSDSKAGYSYCKTVPKEYKSLLCFSLLVQYISQQISIPLHEGFAEYMKHFVEYSKRSAKFVFAAKAGVVSATLMLNFIPSELNPLDILVVVFCIVLVQGLIQTLENMIVHVRREEHEARQPSEPRGKNTLSTFYRQSITEQSESPTQKSPPDPSSSPPRLPAPSIRTPVSPVDEIKESSSNIHFDL